MELDGALLSQEVIVEQVALLECTLACYVALEAKLGGGGGPDGSSAKSGQFCLGLLSDSNAIQGVLEVQILRTDSLDKFVVWVGGGCGVGGGKEREFEGFD